MKSGGVEWSNGVTDLRRTEAGVAVRRFERDALLSGGSGGRREKDEWEETHSDGGLFWKKLQYASPPTQFRAEPKNLGIKTSRLHFT